MGIKITPASLIQAAVLLTAAAVGWGTLQAGGASLQREIDRIDRTGPLALNLHKQEEQQASNELVRRLDVLTVEVRHTREMVAELNDLLKRRPASSRTVAIAMHDGEDHQ